MADEKAAPKLTWQVDTTHPEQAQKIREALRQVVDPELGLSIVELGLVREVTVAEEGILLRMILTTPFCPYGPALIEMARSRIEQALGLTTRVDLAPEMWTPSMMEGGAAEAWGLL
jgi:metal-sulfur cluster biosynthetic enzyme